MVHDRELVARLRACLAVEGGCREIKMFGGLAFMVNEKMVVCASNDGGLLVRVNPVDHQAYLQVAGASQAEMGKGRTMGAGWTAVSPAAIASSEQLRFWVDAALSYNAAST